MFFKDNLDNNDLYLLFTTLLKYKISQTLHESAKGIKKNYYKSDSRNTKKARTRAIKRTQAKKYIQTNKEKKSKNFKK